VADTRRRLDADGLAEVADQLLLAAPDRGRRLLVVIDQFEELLTQASAAERARFAGLWRPALAGRVQTIATLRPEFLDRLLVSSELSTLPTRTHMLRPLSRAALREVIEGPAELAGIRIGKEMVDRLVADTGSGRPCLCWRSLSPSSPRV
jgi:hypothetical protein